MNKKVKLVVLFALLLCIIIAVLTLPKSENEYKTLCIGNSITNHAICDYWWGEWGMAASKRENDYVHQLAQNLGDEEYKNTQSYNFYIWEAQAADRAETLTVLDSYLTDDLNLVVIQLGENVTDITTFESDFEELINYVKAKAPKAEIKVIGEFWGDGIHPQKDEMKKQACKNCGRILYRSRIFKITANINKPSATP